MHLLLLSDYETQGGAAQAASRLAQGLCQRHRVTRLVLNPDGQDHPWETIPFSSPVPARPSSSATAQFAGGLALLHKVGRRLLPRWFPRPGTSGHADQVLHRWLRRLRPDLINLHNLHGGAPLGWSPSFLRVCARQAPVVWALHDMWSFTGRCAFAYDCRRFLHGCDAACPTPGEHPQLSPAHIAPAWRQRRRLLTRVRKVAAVTPSRWLAQEARAGLWADHPVEVIPNGLDTDVFRPLPRQQARAALGLPLEGPLVLLAAYDLTERRKGAELLPRMWPALEPGSFTLLTLGRGNPPPCPAARQVIHLGWVEQEERKVLAYNAADLLLHPAPVDNLPNTVVEALACGTTVVALPIGGLPEMVQPGISGWLAPDASAAALGQTLRTALASLGEGTEELRASCRRLALQEFSLERQTLRYEQLFEKMIGG